MSDFLELRIKEILPEAVDAITLILEEINDNNIIYKAGQFLTLVLNINGRELRRSYSLSSSPDMDADLAITIKRVENGEVSRYLIENLKEGDIIHSIDPAGRFTIETSPENERDVFLIGAGSGITPLFSLLKTLLKREPLSKATLIISNRSEGTTLFWKQIKNLKKLHPDRLNFIYFFSDPSPKMKQHQGRLNIGLLEKLVEQNLTLGKTKAAFYTCGPYEYMRMVKMTLIYMGFDEDQIHRENFFMKSAIEENPIPEDISSKEVHIIYRDQKYSLNIPYNKTILKAALETGLQLPYSCLAGICSTCIGKCSEGTVSMANNEVLTDKEVNEGWILTCVSYPKSNRVVVEFK